MRSRTLLGLSALIFAASTVATIVWCGSMSAMGGMEMPGGWTMSMAWMRMPGQTWAGAAATFVGMWAVMMVAMMMPVLVPMLMRYRQAVGGRDPHLDRRTAIVGAGYFSVWIAQGAIAFPLGVALAELEMRQPAIARWVPPAAGAIVLIAGLLQFTGWKARQLDCCRAPKADSRTAWRHGLRLGTRCSLCCAGPTSILLVLGVMDLRAMAVVGAAIAAERLAPAGAGIARAVGIAAVVGGALMMRG